MINNEQKTALITGYKLGDFSAASILPDWLSSWLVVIPNEHVLRVLENIPVDRDLTKVRSAVTIFRLESLPKDQDTDAINWIIAGHKDILKGRAIDPDHDFKQALEKLGVGGNLAAYASAYNYNDGSTFALSFDAARNILGAGYAELEAEEMVRQLQALYLGEPK